MIPVGVDHQGRRRHEQWRGIAGDVKVCADEHAGKEGEVGILQPHFRQQRSGGWVEVVGCAEHDAGKCRGREVRARSR